MLAAVAITALAPAMAQDGEALVPFPIGYVHLESDPRQNPRAVYYQIPVAPPGRAIIGADVAIIDSELIGAEIGVGFSLQVARSDDPDVLAAEIAGWVERGIHFVVADLPASALLQLADAVAELPVTIFNTSAEDDPLRGAACRENVIHVIPSYRMLTDAYAQFLLARRWKDVLVLRGPTYEDRALVDALLESAQGVGAQIVDVRDIVQTDDPRNPVIGNVALLTASADYDVVFVADSIGEFARIVPYRTSEPRPIIGSAGMVATAWHWSWERAGAPQLNARFEYLADRRMGPYDWAAWVSVRGIVQAVLRAGSTDYDEVLAFFLSGAMNLDGAKASPLSVRPWNHQIRQPILLATNNAVVEIAPLAGFVHPVNDLDTLGVDRSFSECRW
jgi:ABC transporter substrate binding protein (PQQ-dependent alcohol dehydrogenase system)